MEEYFDENGSKRTRVKKAKHVGQKLTLKMKMSGGPQGVKKPVKEQKKKIVEDPLVLNTFKLGDKRLNDHLTKAPMTTQHKNEIKSAFKDFHQLNKTVPQSPVAAKQLLTEEN